LTRANQLLQEPTEWCVNGTTFPRNAKQRIVFLGPVDAPQLSQLAMIAMYNEAHGSGCAAEESVVVAAGDLGRDLTASFKTVKQRIRQRMFNIEHVKAASVIGVVCASLGIRHFKETAEQVRAMLIRGGKRAYIIFVGHLNQYKLANFVDSVDCFCVIACPNSRIAHFTTKADNIMKPLASPIEVAIALGHTDFMSSSAFTVQFQRILGVEERAIETEEGAERKRDESLGTLITTRPMNVAVVGSSALERLNERAYVGLEPKVGETPVQTAVVQGRAGIAKGYETEAAAQDGATRHPSNTATTD
jgi:hypothetical protein